ncbi:DNA-directed RNA polymerases I and III subunit RPAC1 [Tetrabaena socialis]|uniref:Plastid-encoded RNA polymerase subunit alpha n=1 Tax=Tetrabaena socialis TaxID=47790 RepID=A0A2J8AIZ4_9CHLO|nr:DNA-directed RNA polymerases I and III subunit RPAC1 [Tetrabaena socialis]|eukprot:PNH12481.1 DNA-directed RNA polymerases I and III subunit RPAC1 [Tetrabaena socialis]
MGKDKGPALPKHLELRKDYVTCSDRLNYNVNTFTSANTFRAMGVDNSWDFEEFKNKFQIVIKKLDKEVMEFDMIGVDPAIANALRRILIAEVPTMAIEHVFVVNNTSIIQPVSDAAAEPNANTPFWQPAMSSNQQPAYWMRPGWCLPPDEVLAHRLGLVPLLVPPHLFEPKVPEEAPSEKNTVVFKLDVACKSSYATRPSTHVRNTTGRQRRSRSAPSSGPLSSTNVPPWCPAPTTSSSCPGGSARFMAATTRGGGAWRCTAA